MNWKFWLGILISIVFLYLSFRKVELKEVIEALRDANYFYLFPTLIAIFFTFLFRVYRWRYLLLPTKKVGIASLFSATMIGFMANNILPARMGEVIKVYFLGRRENISKSLAFATVVLERIFDMLIILLFLAVILIISPFPDWVRKAGYFTTVVYLVTVTCLIGLKLQSGRVVGIIQRCLFFLPKRISERIIALLWSFVEGLNVLGKLKYVLMVTFYSLLLWIVSGLTFYFVLFSFGINLPIYVSFFVMIITALGIAVPSAPGFIGNFQFFCITALAIFGVEKNIALSYSILIHVISFIPVTLIGVICLCKENISLAKLSRK